MDIKLSIEMKLLSQFLNAKYLDYKIIDNNQLLCNELVFKYKKDFFNNIKIIDCDDNYRLNKILQETEIFQFYDKLLSLIYGTINGYYTYQYGFRKMLKSRNVIKIEDLMMKDIDEFNNLCNKIITRTSETEMYPFMYYTELPEKYNVASNYTIKVPFVHFNDNDISNKKIYKDFNLGFPIHPLNFNNIQEKKYRVDFIECFVSASNRTFTNKNIPFYFKVDVPCRISGSVRNLTRSESRMKASKIAKNNIEEFNNKKEYKLFLLEDIGFIEKNNMSFVVRHKEKDKKIIPFHALLSNDYFIEKNILDWFIENGVNNNSNVLEYSLETIIFPILDIFDYFVGVSKNYNKFVQPYNFHKQNLGIVLNNKNKIEGFYAQDFDMDLDLTPENVCLEFDTMLTGQIIYPIIEQLQKYYGVDSKEVIKLIRGYIFIKCKNITQYLYDKNVQNKSYHINFLNKDLFKNIFASYWLGGPNPLRNLSNKGEKLK